MADSRHHHQVAVNRVAANHQVVSQASQAVSQVASLVANPVASQVVVHRAVANRADLRARAAVPVVPAAAPARSVAFLVVEDLKDSHRPLVKLVVAAVVMAILPVPELKLVAAVAIKVVLTAAVMATANLVVIAAILALCQAA